MNFEGQNISLSDALFVDNITGDLENWRIKSESITRVLVFPPVNNYHRFLIHKVTETGFPEFATFSVGEGQDRRTVVCFQQQIINFTLGLTTFEQAKEDLVDIVMGEGVVEAGREENSLQTDFDQLESASGAKTLLPVPRIHPYKEDSVTEIKISNTYLCPSSTPPRWDAPSILDTPTSTDTSPSQDTPPSRRAIAPSRRKRPERAVYIPPSRGQPLNPSAPPYISPTTSPTRQEERAPHPLNPLASPWVSPPTSPCHSSPASPSRISGREPFKYKCKKPDRGVYVAPRGRGKQVQCNSTTLDIKPGSPEQPAEDVTEQVVQEITTAVGGVQIEVPEIDYLAFRTSDSTINIDQFGHVIELYDFPGHLTTQDIVSAFSSFKSRWDIKWVDDTHALGVFSSPEAAAEALAAPHPTIKSRPLNMATTQSKLKAKSVCELLLPYKARPATSTAPARRLLQWALGSDKKVPAASKAEQERLREAIKKKEDERRKRKKQERKEGDEKWKICSEHDDR